MPCCNGRTSVAALSWVCHPTPFHPTPVQDWFHLFFRSCAGSLGEAAPPGIDETNSGRSLIPRATLIDNWLHIWIVRFTFFFCQRLTAVIFIAPFPDATILPPWLGFTTCHLPQNSRQNGIILLPPWLWVHCSIPGHDDPPAALTLGSLLHSRTRRSSCCLDFGFTCHLPQNSQQNGVTLFFPLN